MIINVSVRAVRWLMCLVFAFCVVTGITAALSGWWFISLGQFAIAVYVWRSTL